MSVYMCFPVLSVALDALAKCAHCIHSQQLNLKYPMAAYPQELRQVVGKHSLQLSVLHPARVFWERILKIG